MSRPSLLPFVATTALGLVFTGCSGGETAPSKPPPPSATGAETSSKTATDENVDTGEGTPLMRAKPEDKIVTINGVDLLGAEYRRSFVHQARAIGLPANQVPLEVGRLLETPTLEQMEKRELLYQEAKRQKLVPTPEEFREELAAAKAKMSEPKVFETMLARLGATEEEYEQGLLMNVSIKRLVDKTTIDYGMLDEKGARRVYEQNPDKWSNEKRVDLRQILVATPPGASEEAIGKLREKAESLRVEVLGKSKEVFEKVAKEKSDDARTKGAGGHFGIVPTRALLPDLGAVAFGLKPGEVSSPVRTEKGFHILRSEGVSAKRFKFDEVKKTILAQENRHRQNLAIGQLLERLREEATIVRHIQPTPLPAPQMPAADLGNAMGPGGMPPGGMGPGGMGPGGMPGGMGPGGMGMNPHNAANGIPLGDLPPPTKDNVLPGMRNPHGGGGHGGGMPPAGGNPDEAPALKLGGSPN